MFMMNIPTYRVQVYEVDSDSQDWSIFRVPQTELDAFTRVLNFNGFNYWVEKEEFIGYDQSTRARIPTQLGLCY